MISGYVWRRHRGAAGMTIFELVLVLAIIGVLAAIAAPRYGAAIARYRADLSARRVVADLELARSNAYQTSQSRTVTFDLSANEASIPGLEGLKGMSYSYITRFGQQPYQAQLIYADFGGDAEVIFDGWGLPDTDGQVILQVGDITKTVSLDEDTGKATVQ